MVDVFFFTFVAAQFTLLNEALGLTFSAARYFPRIFSLKITEPFLGEGRN